MTEFNEKLRSALDAEDLAFLKALDSERGLFTQMGDTLRGPLGGWATLTFVLSLPLAGFLFYAIWQMFTVTDTRQQILWSAGALAALLMSGFIKQWFFDRMNFVALLRELKRIELRIARIEDR